jgi:hypothetical protein
LKTIASPALSAGIVSILFHMASVKRRFRRPLFPCDYLCTFPPDELRSITIITIPGGMQSILSESGEINGMKLRNRFVRSATWEGMASPEGAVTPKLIETMTLLAKGGVGLIISSHAYVRPEGQATPWQIGVYEDRLIDGLRKMTAAVHEAGGRIVLQLAHAGDFAAENLTGTPPLVVSDYEGLAKTPRKELTLEDIEELVGALRSRRQGQGGGFDESRSTPRTAICSVSSSPRHSTDAGRYASIQRQSCIHREILHAIRKVTGGDYPVLAMNCRLTEDGSAWRTPSPLRSSADAASTPSSQRRLRSAANSPSRPPNRLEDKESYFREELRALETASHPPDPGRRQSVLCCCRTARDRRVGGLYLHEPSVHLRAGPDRPLAVGRPPQSGMQIRQSLFHPGSEGGNPW